MNKQKHKRRRRPVIISSGTAYGTHAQQVYDFYPATGKRFVIVIHGGGFTGGDKKDFTNAAKHFQSLGYPTANMNYRLAVPGYPNQVQDVLAMLKHLEQKYGATEFVLYGHSSGGSLAMLITLAANKPPATFGAGYPLVAKIVGAIGTGGVYDSALLRSRPRQIWTSWANGNADANVIAHADVNDPRVLILAGDRDTTGPWLASKNLNLALANSEYHLLKGCTHNGAKLYGTRLNATVAGYVKNYLNG